MNNRLFWKRAQTLWILFYLLLPFPWSVSICQVKHSENRRNWGKWGRVSNPCMLVLKRDLMINIRVEEFWIIGYRKVGRYLVGFKLQVNTGKILALGRGKNWLYNPTSSTNVGISSRGSWFTNLPTLLPKPVLN